ncbi:MAG: YaeQ family protein [Betaproteobacteria bacterium]
MALKSTIFKAALQIADMERGYYADHALTIARHPSETDERMMLRVLAFALHASADLAFGNGLSTDDEPDLWRRDLTGAIGLWIDVGQPDERLVRRACGRAVQVIVYTYGRGGELWWGKNRGTLERMDNLTVMGVPIAASRELAELAHRTMQLQCTIQDGHVWLGDKDRAVEVALTTVRASGAGAVARRLL